MPSKEKKIELVGGPMCGMTIDVNVDSNELAFDSEVTGRRLVYRSRRKGAAGQECFYLEECSQGGER